MPARRLSWKEMLSDLEDKAEGRFPYWGGPAASFTFHNNYFMDSMVRGDERIAREYGLDVSRFNKVFLKKTFGHSIKKNSNSSIGHP